MTLIYKSRSSGGQVADRATDFALVDNKIDRHARSFFNCTLLHLVLSLVALRGERNAGRASTAATNPVAGVASARVQPLREECAPDAQLGVPPGHRA